MRVQGIHLRLPGCGPEGPTLEVFQYSELKSSVEPAANRPGFAHIAFAVASVSDARTEVLSRAGSAVGEIVRITTAPNATVVVLRQRS